MAIDFSTLMNQTPEERETKRLEREADRARNEQKQTQEDILSRGSRSTQRISITIEEVRIYPEYDKRNGAMIRGINAKNEIVDVLIQPLLNENYDAFRDRFATLREGDKLTADGLYERRSWKDHEGNWQSKPEFQALMPIAPASLTLANRVSGEMNIPPSAFAKQQTAAQAQGLGR